MNAIRLGNVSPAVSHTYHLLRMMQNYESKYHSFDAAAILSLRGIRNQESRSAKIVNLNFNRLAQEGLVRKNAEGRWVLTDKGRSYQE